MKKTRIYIHTAIAFFILMITVSSCKKSFLEVVPKGNLVATTYDDYNLLMNGSNFYNFNNKGIWQPAMLMGDEVSAEALYYNRNGFAQADAIFQYDPTAFNTSATLKSADNPSFSSIMLTNIYTLNTIIVGIDGASGGTPQQKADVKAQAMATRAFTNFQLINYFAKPYAAATAATDPGFPIITVPDITANKFSRGNVQAMYDFIISDLKSAISNLNVSPSFATRWSKPAAEGLLGKVYLFMGRYSDALAMLNASFSDISKMSNPPKLYNYNIELAAGGSFLPASANYGPKTPFGNITDLTESVVGVFSYCGSFIGNGYGNDFLSLTPQTTALFNATDLRLQLYTNKQMNNTLNPGGRLRRFSTPGSFYARIGVELPDLYLLRSEAKARANDLTGAVADLQTLRTNRMPAAQAVVPAATAADQTSLIKFIINERIREFACFGYRWFDMRRLSADPIFAGQPASVHTLYLATGATSLFPLTQDRLTLRIPQAFINSNPDMINNP